MMSEEAETASQLVGLVRQVRQLVSNKRHVFTRNRDVWMGDAIASLLQVAHDLEPALKSCEHEQLRGEVCLACGESVG